MTRKILTLAVLLLALGGSAAPAQAGTLTLSGQQIVRGDNKAQLKETWLCGRTYRDGRTTHSWIRRFSFTSGTGQALSGYEMVRGVPDGHVSKDGPVAARCYLRPTWHQLGYRPAA